MSFYSRVPNGAKLQFLAHPGTKFIPTTGPSPLNVSLPRIFFPHILVYLVPDYHLGLGSTISHLVRQPSVPMSSPHNTTLTTGPCKASLLSHTVENHLATLSECINGRARWSGALQCPNMLGGSLRRRTNKQAEKPRQGKCVWLLTMVGAGSVAQRD
jgi:hypothetical protein